MIKPCQDDRHVTVYISMFSLLPNIFMNPFLFDETIDVFKDEKLRKLVEVRGISDWKAISEYFTDRTDIQCQYRWYKVLNPDLIKGPWTKEVRCDL